MTFFRLWQATDWEEAFTKHISDKRLVLKKYKELSTCNCKKTNAIKKWKEIFEQALPQRNYIDNK